MSLLNHSTLLQMVCKFVVYGHIDNNPDFDPSKGLVLNTQQAITWTDDDPVCV